MERTQITYAEALVAEDALVSLSKNGGKDGATLKRLSQMLRYVRKAKSAFETRRDVILNSYAELENGEIKVRVTENGAQSAVIRNEIEFQRAMNAAIRDAVEVQGEPPRPFTWDEITKQFKEQPDADVIERLGPFVEIPEE